MSDIFPGRTATKYVGDTYQGPTSTTTAATPPARVGLVTRLWRALWAADADYARARRVRVHYAQTPSEATTETATTPVTSAPTDGAVKEPTVKCPVRVTPTSNGYLISLDVPTAQVPTADALVVVETTGKNADDVAHAIGAAVVLLSEKMAAR